MNAPPPQQPARPTSPRRLPDEELTVTWGWVLLVLTWVTFLLGIGGVFGVWDWVLYGSTSAQDISKDDWGFPMERYWTHLVVLTGAVVWVWVVWLHHVLSFSLSHVHRTAALSRQQSIALKKRLRVSTRTYQ
ncbi:hypothetical protein G7K_6111-t1 [Saitoella complicata NRRL Y-17804]|uniref:Uncharacterized protein n=1 Tax=Saitoella complicata (strain BCRC 22490 / CBS 7301 / JCM 7358 / NBRC 10748 / NRRL Y-17804) TaxID=698492 RepID=A0A0E9NQE9_SAICN|nr:hypothetical protein G7K_6111-t1 [Saitoella complicata NRRL Y-17804]